MACLKRSSPNSMTSTKRSNKYLLTSSSLSSSIHNIRTCPAKSKDKPSIQIYMQCSILLCITVITIFYCKSSGSRSLSLLSTTSIALLNSSSNVLVVKASAFTNLPTVNDANGDTPIPIIYMYDIYKNEHEMLQRSHRFPSKEQRLKVYMSSWYIPPCNSNSDHRVQYRYDTDGNVLFLPIPIHQVQLIGEEMTTATNGGNDANNMIHRISTTIVHDRNYLVYNEDVMSACSDPFCRDVKVFLKPSLNRIIPTAASSSNTNVTTEQFPIILQFGDAELSRAHVPELHTEVYSPMVPFLRKYRYSITPSNLERVTSFVSTNNDKDEEQCFSSDQKRLITGTVRNPVPKPQAIITIVSHYQRHFIPLNDLNNIDISWDKKYNMAVYRGALTGRNRGSHKASNEEYCTKIPRCNLVYRVGNSSFVDAKLVPYGKFQYPFEDPLNGIKMFGNPMSMEEMLRYKAIVMLEGNDVSSGFKWALFSNSVVLTQTPTCTSWAMEELLQPWVHYIPINDDLSDVEEKVQWMIDHDAEAQTIARNGRLWIADLVYHPDAEKENEEIIDETLKRYRSYFTYNPSLAL